MDRDDKSRLRQMVLCDGLSEVIKTLVIICQEQGKFCSKLRVRERFGIAPEEADNWNRMAMKLDRFYKDET